jgi:hypothetical protein
MSLLRFDRFAGANLALHPLIVPPGVGVACWNQRPGRGDLRPWKAPLTVATVPGGSATIYRMGRDAVSDAAYWLAWSTKVDVARGMLPGDDAERTFWTGNGQPKWTDASIGLGATPYPTSTGVRLLGVPVPDATPSLTQTVAGSGDDESRAYVVTWVNDREEESAPSTAAVITTKPGATIRVTRNASVPSGAHGLTKWRIYRTVAGSGADYLYVTEAAAATAFVDTGDAFNAFNPLPSAEWDYPDGSLAGLTSLWNGMMAAFKGKDLYFCEPFRPFAWPEAYRVPLDDEIVALARWRTSLVVLTTGHPYLVSGSSPESMQPQPLEIDQACIAALGVVAFGHGVAWPSRDGLNYIGDGGYRMLTGGRALQEDWLALNPGTLIAGRYEGLYVGSYDPGGGRKSFIIDPSIGPGDPVGLYFCDSGFTAAHYDQLADSLYVLNGANVQKWNAGSTLTATFDSRTERLVRPESMAWGQVIASSYPVTLSVWSDGQAVLSSVSVASGKAFRLPRGKRGAEWKIRVATAGAVQGVTLAGSLQDLRQVP